MAETTAITRPRANIGRPVHPCQNNIRLKQTDFTFENAVSGKVEFGSEFIGCQANDCVAYQGISFRLGANDEVLVDFAGLQGDGQPHKKCLRATFGRSRHQSQ